MPLLFYNIHQIDDLNFTHDITFLDEENCEIRTDSFKLMCDLPIQYMNKTKICSIPGCENLKKQTAANVCKDHKSIYPHGQTMAAKMFARVGYRNTYQKKSTQEASKKTLMERYGVEHQMQIPEVKSRLKRTNEERYGFEHHFSSNGRRTEIQAKAQKTRYLSKYNNETGPMELREEWRKVFLEEGFQVAMSKFPIGTSFCYKFFITEEEKKKGSIIQNDAQRQLEKATGMCFKSNVRNIVPGNGKLEIDFVNHEHQLSFEFNGIWWHRDSQEKDLAKAEAMRSIGYRHFVLDETTMHLIPKIAKMVSPNKRRIYARKCEIVELQSGPTLRKFFSEHHLQGYANSSVKLGLFDGIDLIQVMTFGKPRFNKKIDWEIIRLATRSDMMVVGGTERLFSHFRKTHSGSIVSFSDNRFFDGGVYERLGMKFQGNTGIGYQWVRDGIALKRYQTMKHKLPDLLGDEFDINLTEAENMKNAGFESIPDLGQKKWTIT